MSLAFLPSFPSLWRPVLEIGVMAVFFYYLFRYIRGTRAVQVLKGLIILIVIFFLAQRLRLETVNWLLTKVFPVAVIALIILFQPELRRVLASLGGNPFLPSLGRSEGVLDKIVEAGHILSKRRIGALIAIEDEVGLKNYIESGVKVDAVVSTELLMTLFHPKTPLHDGGVIIEGDHVAAAACLFPLTQQPNIEKSMGTRHRAALGLTEETDAVVIVVSEETGKITVAMDGKFSGNLDQDRLKEVLRARLIREGKKRKWFTIRKSK
ncbi:MAG: TIGR00159 family protein [Chlamydiae bacterium]|nr:TIGR00159 family protein [Chlamydiota bacterium]MBI3278021.1 TIGR00159 family protein [Chlamydiota bacterium]